MGGLMMGFDFGSFRGTQPRQRDVQRIMSTRRVREPISASLKKKVLARANNTCERRGCNHKQYLEFHHKNMNNDDNKVSNIIVLCPNHHREIHDKYKKVAKKDLAGREINPRVVSKEKARQIKQSKRDDPLRGLVY